MRQSSKQSKCSAKVFNFKNLLIIKSLHESVRLRKGNDRFKPQSESVYFKKMA
jgi:hypothetical protein